MIIKVGAITSMAMATEMAILSETTLLQILF